MTALQKEVMELIPRIPDDKLYYILQILNGVNGLAAQSDAVEVPKRGERIIGIAEGEKFLADGYDMDAEDPEITALFEAI